MGRKLASLKQCSDRGDAQGVQIHIQEVAAEVEIFIRLGRHHHGSDTLGLITQILAERIIKNKQ